MTANTRGWATALLLVAGFGLGMVRLQHPTAAAAHADAKAEGAELFAKSGCAHCHGNDGQGTDKAPSLRNLRKKMPADKITDQIVHGGQGMPAFGDALKPEEVQDLVAFLRAKTWMTPPQPTPPQPTATPTESPSPAPPQ